MSISAVDFGAYTLITIRLFNASGFLGTHAGTVFTDIGLWGLGSFSLFNGGELTLNGQSSSGWTLAPNGLSGSGIQPNVAGVGAAQPQLQNGISSGALATFTFKITGIAASSIDVRDWAIHGQNGPNGCSTTLVSIDGSVNNGPFDPSCAPIVTPEPASMILLASGLIGLGARTIVQRRRSAQLRWAGDHPAPEG